MTDMNELRELGVPGFIFLRMKAEDTEQNQRIHDAFREMAAVECKNDYTLALGKLLEYYQADFKIDLLWRALNNMEDRLTALELEVTHLKAQPKEESSGTF